MESRKIWRVRRDIRMPQVDGGLLHQYIIARYDNVQQFVDVMNAAGSKVCVHTVRSWCSGKTADPGIRSFVLACSLLRIKLDDVLVWPERRDETHERITEGADVQGD